MRARIVNYSVAHFPTKLEGRPYALLMQRMGWMTEDIKELTEVDFGRALPARLRKKHISGKFDAGADVAALRTFVRSWEQGRSPPEGPAISLLRIAARHPRVLRENLGSVV